jgi:nucleotide-binding universal stress UspA family protein
MTRKKVVIPIDGSEFSLQVLPTITKMFEPDQTELILLHVAPEPEVIELDPGDPELTVYVDQQEAGLRGNFADDMLPQVRRLEKAGFAASTAMCFGDPTEEIERFVDDESIDMVAMTTHGRTGLARMMFGSVAEHVLHHSKVPIMIYRSFADGTPE